jgi:hypothetical protein
VRAADLVVVTGDHASGPQPGAVLDRMLKEVDRLRLVRGNADRELVALRRGEDIEIPDDVTPWAAAQLTEDQVELLAGLPHPLVIDRGEVHLLVGGLVVLDDDAVGHVDTEVALGTQNGDPDPPLTVSSDTDAP